MKIIVRTEDDALTLEGDKIIALSNNKKFIYDINYIRKIYITTSDQGPLYDDMGMLIYLGDDNLIFVYSEHKSFSQLLFEKQMSEVLNIDYKKVIEACSCVENNSFEIYSRD